MWGYQQLDIRTVTTRKSHRCWGCAAEFPPKTSMEYSVGVMDGDICAAYWCATCRDRYNKMSLDEKLEGIDFGDFAECSTTSENTQLAAL